MALGFLIAAFAALVAYHGSTPGSAGNARTELLERLGSQATSISSDVRSKPTNSIVLGASRRGEAAAEWSMSDYEFAHDLPNATACSMAVYVSGPNVSGVAPSAAAEISLDGTRIASLRFGGLSPDFPVVRGRIAPLGVTPADVPMTPLFNPSALVFPVGSEYCRAGDWRIGVHVRDASWPIDRVGVIARYAPAASALAPQNALVIVIAVAIVLALISSTHLLFNAVYRSYGPVMLALTLGLFACALVTHDEWDFPVWLRFVDLVAFGHANPANMWGGTPLWPLGLGIFAPLLSTVFASTGDGSQEIAALFVKLAMALATSANAFLLARAASPKLRRFLFPILLLSPYGLYELAGGYREIFAGSFFLLGASLSLRGRFAYGALAMAAATSISESLAPLVLLPAALRLASGPPSRRPFALATLDVAAGVVPLAFQWLVLVAHGAVATTVSARVTEAYRFGGGSWYSTLDGFHLLPPWVGAHSALLVFAVFAILVAPLVALIVRDLGSRSSGDVRRKRIFGSFVGFVAAFFLAYRGIDPSTWYALWIVTAFYFVRFEASNPFPLFLSAVQAVAFYAILGIGDFANSTYVMPSNASLLGVLGRPMLVAVLAVNLTILALYVSRVARDSSMLFGRGSTWFFLLFFAAFAAGAIKIYPVDTVFCVAAALLILIAFHRWSRLQTSGESRRRSAVLDYCGLASVMVAGVAAGTQNPAAGLVAFVAILLGVSFGFGTCDIVLATMGTLLVGTQYGFGWISIGGYIVLSLLAVAAIAKARAATTLAKA